MGGDAIISLCSDIYFMTHVNLLEIASQFPVATVQSKYCLHRVKFQRNKQLCFQTVSLWSELPWGRTEGSLYQVTLPMGVICRPILEIPNFIIHQDESPSQHTKANKAFPWIKSPNFLLPTQFHLLSCRPDRTTGSQTHSLAPGNERNSTTRDHSAGAPKGRIDSQANEWKSICR